MTTIYMVRNAECEDLQDASSNLSVIGQMERRKIRDFFEGKKVDSIYLSSFKSAANTLDFFTEREGVGVHIVEEFDERRIGPRVANLDSFTRRQFIEPEYQLPGGESFLTAQNRIIDGLEKVVTISQNEVCVIGTHSMAIALAIHFFDESYHYEEYRRATTIKPWIVKMEFEGKILVSLEEISCV